MKTAILLGLCSALAACGGDQTSDPTAPGLAEVDDPAPSVTPVPLGSWIARADYPRGIWHATSASVPNPGTLRSTLYVIGGTLVPFGGPGRVTTAVKAYDVTANIWRSKAPYPIPISSTNGAVEIDGKIYVSGGFTRRWDEQHGVWRLQDVGSLYVYDPATNSWTRKRDMPTATVEGVSAAYRGLLYVATACYDGAVCGEDSGFFSPGALWRYNPVTDRWVLLTRTPHNPGYGGGGFIGGKLYLVAPPGEMDIYDVASGSWTTGLQRPYRRCTPASITFQARLYLAGCHEDDDDSGVDPMLVFDPDVGAWAQVAAPPVAAERYSSTLSRVLVDGRPRLELIGGAVPGNNWRFVP